MAIPLVIVAEIIVGVILFQMLQPSNLRYEQLVEQVVPPAGKAIVVHWGDMGRKLVEAGAIDLAKFESRYGGLNAEQRAILQGESLGQITLRPDNVQFWTNVLWALGLTQQSRVLADGPMIQNLARTPLENYASTAGWRLGSKSATALYNSAQLIALTPAQDEMIYRVAEGIFRPCCGNHTAYPDCNHGMAMLGLLELLASQGASEAAMYEAALTFNSYAFASSYIRVAAYWAQHETVWSEVDPALVLGPEYSSLQGAQRVAALVGEIPGAPKSGGSCSA
ncbi:MAG: hypothetical protein Kow00106_25200 [Anaerolineae bacterium]